MIHPCGWWKIICIEFFGQGPLNNFTMILSISFLSSFLGSGRVVAMWVSLERRHDFIMITFAVVVSFILNQRPILVLIIYRLFPSLDPVYQDYQ